MWALVDCDNFFCSCERVFRPDLNGRPVVVLSNNDGCVVARTAEVKAMGVKEGMPYFKMLEEFPGSGITAFSSNYELYADMSARVMAVLAQNAPEIRQYSIDEAFLNLDGMNPEGLKKWGEDLAAKVRRWTGMPVSIGIAPTRTLAKVATRFAKRYPGYNRCCMIATEEQREKALKLFDTGDVWGIGRRIARSLEYYGITKAWDFAQKSKSWVRSRYHVTGERTWLELRGINAIETEKMEEVTKKSILTSRSLPEMLTDLEQLKPHVANFAARCALKLRRQRSVAGMVTVFVQSNYFREDLSQYSMSASMRFPTATAISGEIVSAAMKILGAIFKPGIHYKRAGVMVTDISSADAFQPDLFFYDEGKRRKAEKLCEIIDGINRRLGADAVSMAAQQYPQKDADGKNIAYTLAIRRSMKSPNYSTRIDSFRVK